VGAAAAKFDLSFNLGERRGRDGSPEGIDMFVGYASDLFDADTIEEICARWVRLLEAAVADPNRPLSRIDILTAQQRRWLSVECNDTAVPIPFVCLPALFEAQVQATPEAVAVAVAVAVAFEDTRLTYRELTTQANQLAHALIIQGVGPEQIVALALPRSPLLVVAIMAVLKAGAAYLPLDPDHPADRLALMLDDAKAACLITVTRAADRLPDNGQLTRLVLDDPRVVTELAALPHHDLSDTDRVTPLHPDHPAYLIYTSGSTGRPKGVLIPHRAAVNHMLWMQQTVPLDGRDTVLHRTSFTFDASVWELFAPLIAGAKLLLTSPETQRDPGALAQLVTHHDVTVLQVVPSLLPPLLQQPALEHWHTLRRLFCGGEALSGHLWAQCRSRLRSTTVYNLYGPTETCIDASYHTCQDTDTTTTIPIGRPITNTRAYVLDAGLQSVPPGVTGELYLAGAGLARGYLHRPDLTAERFLANPYGPPGERLYRTGDLARWRDGGVLEFAGRADNQVKIRGFRIEPGEIETVLTTHPDIAQATVIARHDPPHDTRLVGYVVAANNSAPTSELPDYLRQRLPDYMVPAAFVALDALPLMPNGKLDRSALPVPDLTPTTPSRAPRSPQEQILCELFAEVLGLDHVGVKDSFFTLGGDSIISIQLVSRACRAGVVISPRDVFQHKTAAGLAAVARAAPETALKAPDSGIGVVVPTPIMHRLRERGGPIDDFSMRMVLQAPASLDTDALAHLVQALLDRHDMLRARLEPSDNDGQRWALRVAPVGSVAALACIMRVDAAGLDDEDLHGVIQTREAPAATSRLAPQAGVMIQVAWLDRGPARPGRLVVVIHHLVVDGVSLRILLEDLASGAAQLAAGRAPELQPCRTSFRRWAQLLAAQAHDPVRMRELAMWTAMLGGADPPLGQRALDPARDTASTCRELRLALPTRTEPLLTSVPAAFHAGLDDVLLCGLVLAVTSWRRRRGQDDGHGCLLVDLERHGRQEQVADGVDLSRTVGWFTTMFPVRLDIAGVSVDEALAGGPAAGQALKRVKEQLRAVPDHGLGFGVLRYLNRETGPILAGLATPQIAFNYLGRFAVSDATDWAVVPDSRLGRGAGTALPASHGLNVTAWTEDRSDGPQLHVSWLWPGGLLSQDAVHELAEGWFQALDALATYAARPHAGGHTPSDFPLARLSQEEMDGLATERVTR
jgi:amino acid adenylation domain-containing protein/non-ribosomal peptide synthase protein (TIGR01720 family)